MQPPAAHGDRKAKRLQVTQRDRLPREHGRPLLTKKHMLITVKTQRKTMYVDDILMRLINNCSR